MEYGYYNPYLYTSQEETMVDPMMEYGYYNPYLYTSQEETMVDPMMEYGYYNPYLYTSQDYGYDPYAPTPTPTSMGCCGGDWLGYSYY